MYTTPVAERFLAAKATVVVNALGGAPSSQQRRRGESRLRSSCDRRGYRAWWRNFLSGRRVKTTVFVLPAHAKAPRRNANAADFGAPT